MHLAESYLGDEGLTESFQSDFEEETICDKCHKVARIALVVAECGGAGQRDPEQKRANPLFICDLRQPEDRLWVHDCCSIAIYFCTNCLKAHVEWNQA